MATCSTRGGNCSTTSWPTSSLFLYDQANDEVVAEGHTGPFWWDGSETRLARWDRCRDRADLHRTEGGQACEHTLRARRGEPTFGPGRGLAVQLLTAMREIAGRHGLTHLVAPVRPSWKENYPLADIEHYVRWRRDDGQLLDPWMRVHERLGAHVATPLPEIDADHRDGGSVGELDGDGVSRVGRLCLPRGFGSGAHRPSSGPRLVLGAERLDGSSRSLRVAIARHNCLMDAGGDVAGCS